MSVLDFSAWSPDQNNSALNFGTTQAAFLTLVSIVILLVPRHATVTRIASLFPLCALTYTLQETSFQLCRNPHWRAAVVPLVWIQCMSASELICVSRVDSAHLSAGRGKLRAGPMNVRAVREVVALVWNLRRVGTRWQAKNIPVSSSSRLESLSRARFVLGRITTTFLAYLVLDIMISGPTPDLALVHPQKETLFRLDRLSFDDIIFRTIGTISFWLSTALLNLIMSNSVAIFSVLTGLSSPTDCPPLYGPIGEAYNIRRFWG